VVAQQAQLKVLYQQKAYQRVVAPVRWCRHQAQCRRGDLVHADTRQLGTFMFTPHHAEQRDPRPSLLACKTPHSGWAPGVDAVVRVPEIPDRTFPGMVARIADVATAGTRTLLTEVDIPRSDGVLTAGIYCTIELHIPQQGAEPLVPADAIIST